MKTKRWSARGTLAGIVLLLCVLVPNWGAAATTACTFTAHVTLSPGASLKESTGTFTTRASGVFADTHSSLETGKVSCVATGGRITHGRLGFEGHNGTTPPGEDCAHGTGNGVLSFTIDGRHHVVAYTAVRGAIVGVFATSKDGAARIVGAYAFTPDAGETCIKPVTGATVRGTLL